MKSVIKFFIGFLAMFMMSSCLEDLLDSEVNDNAPFYGSEWSTEKEAEGLKFYKDDSVLYFCEGGITASGTFKYYPSEKIIEFDGLTVKFPSLITEMTYSEVDSSSQMKLHWHELGKSQGYYMVLYKRR